MIDDYIPLDCGEDDETDGSAGKTKPPPDIKK